MKSLARFRKKAHGGTQQIPGQPRGEGRFPGLEGFQAPKGVDVEPQNFLRRAGGQFLDVHAALGRKDQDRLSRLPVEGHGDVDLAFHLDRRFRQNFPHHQTLGTGLVGDQGFAQKTLGESGRLFGRFNEFDAPGLAPAARVDLGFQDPGALADFLKGRGRFSGLTDDRARENRKAETAH